MRANLSCHNRRRTRWRDAHRRPCLLLRRWPRLYALGRRLYRALTFWLGRPHEPDFRLFAARRRVGLVRRRRGQRGPVGSFAARLTARSTFCRSSRIGSWNLICDSRDGCSGQAFATGCKGWGAPSRTTLYVPQRGRTPQTPWATLKRSLLETDRQAIQRELGGPFEVVETPIDVQRFDDLNLHPAVVKIDVEGVELDVLQGMEATLANDEPLLMVEQNQGSATVADWLEARGYLIWSYNAQRHQLRRRSETLITTNFIACTAAWLQRHPSVAALIASRIDNAPAEPGAAA